VISPAGGRRPAIVAQRQRQAARASRRGEGTTTRCA
jgi:hypothetical protein